MATVSLRESSMSKKIGIAFLLIALVIILPAAQSVKAQSAGAIFINTDGSVIGADKIQRNGNVYSLTDNIYNLPIVVECNNIVLDGEGFTSEGISGWSTLIAINLTATNVTVRNFQITNWGVGILGVYDHNTITNSTFKKDIRAIAVYANNYTVTNNTIQKSTYGVRILNGNNNRFFGNQFIDNFFGLDATNSTKNLAVANHFENNNEAFRIASGSVQVYHNNFVDQHREANEGAYSVLILSTNSTANLWGNGYPSGGNYYSDYQTRYPNASEIDNSGIGNTPYQVSANPNVSDRYPLLKPVDISAVASEVQISGGQNFPVAEERFTVQKIMYAFHGQELLCSFNATARSSAEINLSATGDNTYEITVKITSANHGSIYNYTTYDTAAKTTNIYQTIKLSYDDAYNIALAKHPFYSTVTISGTISLYKDNKTATPSNPTQTSSPAPTILPTPSTSPSPTASLTASLQLTQTLSPTSSVPEFSSWTVLLALAIAALISVVIVKMPTRTIRTIFRRRRPAVAYAITVKFLGENR